MSAHAPASLAKYWAVIGSLMVLTLITVFIATVDLGWANLSVAIAIAGVKSVLVAAYFMHLKGGPQLNILAALSGVVFLVLLIFITLSDFLTRNITPAWPQ